MADRKDLKFPSPNPNRFSTATSVLSSENGDPKQLAQGPESPTPPPPLAARYHRLSPSEHTYLIQSLASPTTTPSSLESGLSATYTPTTSTFWPRRSLPPSLYRTVIHSRTISTYQYILSSFFFTILLILQLLLGASLTALTATKWASSSSGGTTITVLAAANTICAGLVALMHNSGLPDRYKNDALEFESVELQIREVLELGLVMEGQTVENVAEECWDAYRKARSTVAGNKPNAYVTSTAALPKVKSGPK